MRALITAQLYNLPNVSTLRYQEADNLMAAATIVQHSSSSRTVLMQASTAKVISEKRPIKRS